MCKPCIQCDHYSARDDATRDICMHPKAEYSEGVRESSVSHYSCLVMRMDRCLNGALFEPKERGGDDEAEQLRAEERAAQAKAREMAREPE